MWRNFSLGVVLILSMVACGHKTGTGPYRTIVPLTINYDAANDNAATPTVAIRLGNSDTVLNVLFDTGSPGLRILKGVIRNTSYTSTARPDTVKYGTPPVFFSAAGTVCQAAFSIGSISTRSPISFQAIDATDYSSTTSWVSTGDSTTIAKNNFRGLCGIMGVGTRSANDGVVSPLAQLPGNGKYIIRFPTYGGTSGTILINPDDADIAGFTFFQLSTTTGSLPFGLNAWQDFHLYGCFTINDTTYWAYSVLDTGNPNMEILSPSLNNGQLPAGDSVHFGLADTLNGPLRLSMAFRVGSPALAGRDRVITENTQNDGGLTMNYPAIMPFFQYDVLYDQYNGIIGLKAK